MNRFLAHSSNIKIDKAILSDKDEVHHLKNVLHLEPGEKIELFDELGQEYFCEISELKEKEIILEIKEKLPARINKIKLTIACAIPKNSKFDDIVDKLTQLGVARIIPLETERVIIKLDKAKKSARLERWQKIALSAVKQSHRNSVPLVDPIRNIKEVFAESVKFDLKLIPHLEGARRELKDVFSEICPKNILVFIGPEGDFSPDEVGAALRAGFIPVSLGDTVLRVETAALAVASFIRLYV